MTNNKKIDSTFLSELSNIIVNLNNLIKGLPNVNTNEAQKFAKRLKEMEENHYNVSIFENVISEITRNISRNRKYMNPKTYKIKLNKKEEIEKNFNKWKKRVFPENKNP